MYISILRRTFRLLHFGCEMYISALCAGVALMKMLCDCGIRAYGRILRTLVLRTGQWKHNRQCQRECLVERGANKYVKIWFNIHHKDWPLVPQRLDIIFLLLQLMNMSWSYGCYVHSLCICHYLQQCRYWQAHVIDMHLLCFVWQGSIRVNIWRVYD